MGDPVKVSQCNPADSNLKLLAARLLREWEYEKSCRGIIFAYTNPDKIKMNSPEAKQMEDRIKRAMVDHRNRLQKELITVLKRLGTPWANRTLRKVMGGE